MRVLLFEDDHLIGEAIKKRLEREGYTVDWLMDGIDLGDSKSFDIFTLIILDLGLPEMDGLEILRKARERGADTPFLILTARDATSDRVAGLDAGADDYLIKPFEMDELLARCRALARRKSGRTSHKICYRDIEILPASFEVYQNGKLVSLSPRTFSILQMLVESNGRVLTRSTLEDHLYGWEGGAESNTLEVFISQIRRKLGADLIKTIRGVGYIVPRDS